MDFRMLGRVGLVPLSRWSSHPFVWTSWPSVWRWECKREESRYCSLTVAAGLSTQGWQVHTSCSHLLQFTHPVATTAILRRHQSQLSPVFPVNWRPVALQEFPRPRHQMGAAETPSLLTEQLLGSWCFIHNDNKCLTTYTVLVGQFNKSSFNIYPFSRFCLSIEPWAI